jgi:hypothetical protein
MPARAVTAAVLIAVLAGCSAPVPGAGGPSGQQPAGPSNQQPDAVVVESISASCVAPPSTDAAGEPTVFEPVLALDGDVTTAWRCPGDGRDQRLTLEFGRPTRITAIAIIPGYAKTDPRDGTDRYRQNRRLSEVFYALDGRSAFEHRLNPAPDLRSPQVLDTGGVVSSSLTVNLISSVPGEPTNGQPPSDHVAISELVVLGAPA